MKIVQEEMVLIVAGGRLFTALTRDIQPAVERTYKLGK